MIGRGRGVRGCLGVLGGNMGDGSTVGMTLGSAGVGFTGIPCTLGIKAGITLGSKGAGLTGIPCTLGINPGITAGPKGEGPGAGGGPMCG